MIPLRSLLYVPGSNARALEKARGLSADAIIIDLEDAVAPEAKAEARDRAVEALRAGFDGRFAALRVNAPDTPWGEADLAAACAAAPAAVLLPKVETAEDVAAYDAALAAAPRTTGLWAMIETPQAMLHLSEIASASVETRLTGLVLGLNDMALEMGARQPPGRAPFLSTMSRTVLAARAFGLKAIDAVYNNFEDDAGFEAECLQARDFGFDGKTLIHPRQVEIANRAFSPSEAELEWARSVRAAYADPANAGRGALRIGGAMAERLHLKQAERWLAMVGEDR